ncbi:MAG: 6-phosphogluconolactonase [Ignavibacteriaceae bacterium]
MNIKIFNTPGEIAEAVSHRLLSAVKKGSQVNRKFNLAVSGGSTPKLLFNRLSEEPFQQGIPWEFLHIFWVDERCVPPGDDESNYGMTKKILLDKVNIPAENIHRIRGEEDPSDEVHRYAEDIKMHLTVKNNLPVFDWILLGMGSDGHTASLFPNSDLIKTAGNICGTGVHPVSGQNRISLTYDIINNAAEISFLVTGKDKAETLDQIRNKTPGSSKYPAAKINPVWGTLEWLIDKEIEINPK